MVQPVLQPRVNFVLKVRWSDGKLQCIHSAKNDVVLSPFMGIGSEGYVAIKDERRFIGIELKTAYFNVAVDNLRKAEKENKELTLF